MASPQAATPPEPHLGCQCPGTLVSLARPTSPPGSFVLKSLGHILCCSSCRSEASIAISGRTSAASKMWTWPFPQLSLRALECEPRGGVAGCGCKHGAGALAQSGAAASQPILDTSKGSSSVVCACRRPSSPLLRLGGDNSWGKILLGRQRWGASG